MAGVLSRTGKLSSVLCNRGVKGLTSSLEATSPLASSTVVKRWVPFQLIRGKEFEKIVLYERGLIKNTTRIGKHIPDSLSNGVISEIKDVNYLYKSTQLKAFLKAGKKMIKPVHLYIAPRTKISRPLFDAIEYVEGKIKVRISPNNYVKYKPPLK